MKKFVKSSLIVGTLFSSLLFVNTSYAADSDTEKNTEGKIEYEGGQLKLDGSLLPSSLNFGKHVIQNSAAETWTAHTNGDSSQPATTGVISVLDGRGTYAGWSVKVMQVDDWTSSTNASDKLLGTKLHAKIDLATGLATAGGVKPTGTSNIVSNDFTFGAVGEDKLIISAKANEGTGKTDLTISQFDLDVPAAAEKKVTVYKTNLRWTVSNTPS